jgi:3'-5' exoribonuclease
MKDVTPIHKFKEGMIIQGFYLCVDKHLRHTRTGDLFIDLVLRDKTGQIHGKVWNKTEYFLPKFDSGDAVVAKAEIGSYQGRLQMDIKKIGRASVQTHGRYGYDPTLIVPSSDYDPKEMWLEIREWVNEFKDKKLKKLVSNIYKKYRSSILICPASLTSHYNFRSGLLESIISMGRVAMELADKYEVDKDLLLTGVLLHDLGKVKELSSSLESNVTDEGNFIGHAVLSRDMMREEATSIAGFPERLSLKLEHMILAHQGQLEWRSSRKPNFPEALLLHQIHHLDKHMNLMKLALTQDEEDSDWTTRNNHLFIPFYKV